MKRGLQIAFLLTALLATATGGAHAWWQGGHMMVARIAYDRLSPKAKADVDRLAKIQIAPQAITAKTLDFINASYWADDVRSDPAFNRPEYQEQHYIDWPYSPDNTPLPGDLPGKVNAVTALQKYVAVLKDRSAPDDARAQALRFIIHFVGDIHQPLHGVSRVTAAFPKGDRGGNDFRVTLPGANNTPPRNGNLHMLWDSGIGAFPAGSVTVAPPVASTDKVALEIVQRFPDSDRGWRRGGTFGYESWSKESFELAKSVVYEGLQPNSLPSAEYVSKSISVAEKRVAWAGYRLASLLNAIYK